MWNGYYRSIKYKWDGVSAVQNRVQILYKAGRMLQQILSGLAFVVCVLLNIGASRVGYANILTGDKDILLPFASMIFLFFPLLIYLPEAHYKVTIFGDAYSTGSHQQAEQQQQKFPYAFLITLLCVTFSILLHRMALGDSTDSEEEAEYRRGLQKKKRESNSTIRNRLQNMEYRVESLILKYYLSLGIGLQNIVSAFYLTIEEDSMIVRNEFIIFCVFSLIINFSYGYLNGWSTVSSELHHRLTNFINLGGIFLGYILGLLLGEDNLILLTLPCLCCGLMIYSCTLVCLPALFSQGEDQTQDKFRYGAIFTALLLTVVYHPFCYLLRV